MFGIIGCRTNAKQAEEKPTRTNSICIISDDHATHTITAYGGIYDSIIEEIKIELNEVKIKYRNNKLLDELRAISLSDFGNILN